MTSRPIIFECKDGAMVPIWRHGNAFNAQFTPGRRYTLAEVEERSRKSHDHYFACVHEAWQSLPEHIAPRFPTDTHLRKWALIKCGFVDITPIVTANNDEAMKTAAWARAADRYAVIAINNNVVTISTARTQKVKRGNNGGMDPKTFQQSKTAVLEFLREMIGVEAGALEANAGQAA